MATNDHPIEMVQDRALANLEEVKVHASSDDADEALAVIQSTGEIIDIDEATNERLLRIIDRNLLPIMCLTYGFQFLDKLVLSYAAVMGMITDVGMKGTDYQWLAGVFYFGYLAWEWPTNRLMQKLPLAKYTAFCIVVWGIAQCTHAAIYNYPGAVAARLFLGAFEAGVTPGFALFTAQWYRRDEQTRRASIWFCSNGFAQILGGFLAYGILKGYSKNGTAGLAPWRWLYLATGLMTIVLGVVFFWHMPDNQLNARWMKEEDRVLAVHRIRVNQQGIGNKHFKRYQFIEALKDPMAWAFTFYACITCIPSGGIANFFNQLIKTFGYDTSKTMLLGTPAGAMLAVSILLNGYFSSGRAIFVGSIGIWTSILGMLLIICVPLNQPVGRLIGYYLCWSYTTGFVTVLCLIGTNIAGYTKKTTVAAMYLIGYCVGYIIGPQVFQEKDAPR